MTAPSVVPGRGTPPATAEGDAWRRMAARLRMHNPAERFWTSAGALGVDKATWLSMFDRASEHIPAGQSTVFGELSPESVAACIALAERLAAEADADWSAASVPSRDAGGADR